METRVVEEHESEDGEVVEISRNFFPVCTPTNNIFYFGEETDIYENGETVSHEGAWLAGVDGASPGLIMPGTPEVGMKYYQEVAPGVAEDRTEIISLSQTASVPAGRFDHVLKTAETTPLDLGEMEKKFYAPGIGLIWEEELKLVRYVAPEVEGGKTGDDASGENSQGVDDPERKQNERRKAVVATESGQEIHQRHMQANHTSADNYSPGLNYLLEPEGVANESNDMTLAMDSSVWKSNGAVVLMDVVGGTISVGEEEYKIALGYALLCAPQRFQISCTRDGR